VDTPEKKNVISQQALVIANECNQSGVLQNNYRVSPIIRPSVIFEDDFNISPTFKISPSWLVGIELSENSARILETDDLQDIPEDDDMIVFD